MNGRYSRRVHMVAGVLLALGISLSTMLPAEASRQLARSVALANPALLDQLTAPQRAMLSRHGFVVTTSGLVQQGWQFYDLYYVNYHTGIPNFITSDAVLHTFHLIYDGTLLALERHTFAPTLAKLSAGLTSVAAYQYGVTTNPAIKQAARLNMGYVAVAARLLDPMAPVPALVAPQVRAELALIQTHQGFAPSPLFGYKVDYSKFVPRGHYARAPLLRRYFQAMTWFGLLSFRLNGPGGVALTRQALLLVRAFQRIPALAAQWAAVFDPLTTWVGPSDDLTMRQYERVAAQVYPANAPVSALADDAKIGRFITLAKALPNPQINDALVASSAEAAPVSKGLRLFGQRFVPDAAIMQGLIWDKVGTAQQKRLWPLGLDVASTLGAARATALLTGPLHQNLYAHYTQRLTTLQRTYSTLPAAVWTQNLYWGWLNALRAVWAPSPVGAPAFMGTTAWANKALAAGLGSWAQLRHDTLLYVKQPEGLGGGGGVSPPRVAYVEPLPVLYARLLRLTQAIKSTLSAAGALDSLPQPLAKFAPGNAWVGYLPPVPTGEQGYRAALDNVMTLLSILQRAAGEELSGHPVAASDMQVLIRVSAALGRLSDFFQLNGAGAYLTVHDRQVAAIADVFTEPQSGQVLEEGVGDVLPLYAVVTIDGRRWLTRGGVFSYYEFHQPMSNRLTDDAWRDRAHRPALPSWTSAYIAP